MTLIDTAEMYADGGAEELVAEAHRGRRDEVFLVSKVLPHQCDAARHDRGLRGEPAAARAPTASTSTCCTGAAAMPLDETLEAFEALEAAGKIRHWGVSNFDVDDMEELVRPAGGGAAVATNQVLYNLTRRGIEYDLLPLVPRARHSDHGLLADRAGPAGASRDACGAIAERHRRDAGAGRAGVGAAAGRRHRHPQGRVARARAREPGRARHLR